MVKAHQIGVDDTDEQSASFGRETGKTTPKKHKQKKLYGRRKIDDLIADRSEDIADETIRRLLDLGHITEIVAELKSGKEATAYIAESPYGTALVKLYRAVEARSFKNDSIYREGQEIVDARAKKAMQSRSKKGMEMLQGMWVCAEYAALWKLWQAGLNVPEPLVGPSVKAYAETVPAVVMRLIGTEDEPAPRLSDARLSKADAQNAWEQAVQGMADLLRLGYAHGDYSTYNLLWWENTVIIMNFHN